MFLTDLLFNCARIRFSQTQQHAILEWAKELGAKDVPTLSELHTYQKTMKAELGDPTQRKTSPQGHVWYLNEIGNSLAKVCMHRLTYYI